MASRVMHLAITDCVSKIYKCRDKNRFRLGSVLPDAAVAGNSHWKISIFGGTKKTYDLTGFRLNFLDKILADDLYLGYYLHLVQDLLFREFVYSRYQWNPRLEGNPKRLHGDYGLLNPYIIEKYGVFDDIAVPPSLDAEPICKVCSFAVYKFLADMKTDFTNIPTGAAYFFTKKMADEFIELTISKCAQEIYALFHDLESIDEIALAWG